jgi:very-short-patch-repair endonuclease
MVPPEPSYGMTDRALQRVAARQLGLFTRDQATDCGYSAFQIRRRLAAGDWQQVCGTALAFRGRQVTAPVWAAAAHLAVPGSVIAGPSAALWYNLPTRTTGRWLWVGPSGRSSLADTNLLRDPLEPEDIRIADGMRITSPARTVVDCMRVLPDSDALTLMDRALQRGWISVGELKRRVRERVGRHGTPRLARFVGAATGGSRSAAERKMARLLRSAGITGWSANLGITDVGGLIGYGDIVFPALRLVVEIDGLAFHSDPSRFQRDRTRQNRLVSAGWTVLRFTWADLRDRPTAVIAEIRAAITRLNR